ncbi:phosphatidylinositol kinase [Thraustotheca clavata]|uniref:phosphatidylinositol 3-kinase n=1 Tax=Thraustotheca clavata TaxID=74557 RepID=A0A1W0A816_9STRA|nr:phosphatidylinositol kinase [Thraustotheca clavata]
MDEVCALLRDVNVVALRVKKQLSDEEQTLRANVPQYVQGSASISCDDFISTIVQFPSYQPRVTKQEKMENTIECLHGYLFMHTKQQTDKKLKLKRRFIELRDKFIYSAKSQHSKQNALLRLDDVSTIKPSPMEHFGIVLVTLSKSILLVAGNDQEYTKWIIELCRFIPYQRVHAVFRRTIQQQEVEAEPAKNGDLHTVLSPTTTVGECIRHFLSQFHQLQASRKSFSNPENEYVLKLTGYRDYFLDWYRPIVDYQSVRECQLQKKVLRLTFVHLSTLDKKPLFVPPQLSQLAPTSPVVAKPQQTPSAPSKRVATYKSADVDEPLQICIHRFTNIIPATMHRDRTRHDVAFVSKRIMHRHIFCRFQLVDGGAVVDGSEFETDLCQLKLQAGAKPVVCYAEFLPPTWHQLSLLPSQMTRTMRLVCTIFASSMQYLIAKDENYCDVLARTGCHIFDVHGMMVQGKRSLALYDNLASVNIGPLPVNVEPNQPCMSIEFCSAPMTNVTYSATPSLRRSLIRASLSDNNLSLLNPTFFTISEPSILKEGPLNKLSSRPWHVWKERWFSLNGDSCCLSMSDKRHSIRSVSVSLSGATVSTADKYNRVYTTFPVNKSTKKEYQTWCFSIQLCYQKTKSIVLCAPTKQERDDWMHLISVVIQKTADMMWERRLDDAMTFVDSNDSNKPDETGRLSMPHTLDIMNNVRGSLRLSSCSTIWSSSGSLAEMAIDTSGSGSNSSSTYMAHTISTSATMTALSSLLELIEQDPLYRLSTYQKSLLWSHRSFVVSHFFVLPRVLSCIQWSDTSQRNEMLELLPKWSSPAHISGYLALLDSEFAHMTAIRRFALGKMAAMDDLTLSSILPQLVQAIKWEPFATSQLVTWLIERALINPSQIGFALFWTLKVETYMPRWEERFRQVLQAYLSIVSKPMASILSLQEALFSPEGEFHRIARRIKKLKQNNNMHEVTVQLRHMLSDLNVLLPPSYQLPIDPRVEVGALLVDQCRVMSSAKLPLWLVFENADPTGEPIEVIFKAGDDVRQDQLTLEMFRLMESIWLDDGLDLRLKPYRCVATSPFTGILEVVTEAVTTADIHHRNGVFGPLQETSFSDWIRQHNPDTYEAAVDIFRRSCAGYCVATYVLGIGDRHNDNIMMTTSGRYFHIDFGHILGHFKYQLNIKREQTPFVFTKEMAHVLGGVDSDTYKLFVKTCGQAFNSIRKHTHLLTTLFLMMLPAEMPELTDRTDLQHLVQAMETNSTEQEAASQFADKILLCLRHPLKRIDNTIHNFVHKLRR